jgi:hypothetical protein
VNQSEWDQVSTIFIIFVLQITYQQSKRNLKQQRKSKVEHWFNELSCDCLVTNVLMAPWPSPDRSGILIVNGLASQVSKISLVMGEQDRAVGVR